VTAKAAKTRESGSQRPGKTNDSNRYGAWSPWSSHPGFVVPNLIKVRDGEAPSPAREARALPGTLRDALATPRLQRQENQEARKPGETNESGLNAAWSPWSSHPGFVVSKFNQSSCRRGAVTSTRGACAPRNSALRAGNREAAR
jgi:hypothetical protein